MNVNLISRQVVNSLVNELARSFSDRRIGLNMGRDPGEIMKDILQLPSAQPRWIPCSERLPEKDGRYLVTCTKWGAWAVDWNIWCNDPKPSWLWEQSVIAWMSLPEPYEADQEGEECI